VSIRVRFYGAKKERLADMLSWTTAAQATFTIPSFSGLFDPAAVRSIECAVDGTSAFGGNGPFKPMPFDGPGRAPCEHPGGLIVDGGPDEEFDYAFLGPDWIGIQLTADTQNFIGDRAPLFAGQPFQVRLDGGIWQKTLVSGHEPQTVAALFTGLQPGMHQIDYGPWERDQTGFHSICMRV
jgi:hypothetical protein